MQAWADEHAAQPLPPLPVPAPELQDMLRAAAGSALTEAYQIASKAERGAAVAEARAAAVSAVKEELGEDDAAVAAGHVRALALPTLPCLAMP